MPAQRQGDGAREIVFNRDADHIGGQRRERRQERPGHGRVDHWNLRKQFGAMAQQKTERLFTASDQYGRWPQGVLLAQERGQGAKVGLAIEAGIVEKLGAQLGRIGERLAQAGFEFEIRRQHAMVGVQHEDVPGRPGQGGWRQQEPARDPESDETESCVGASRGYRCCHPAKSVARSSQ